MATTRTGRIMPDSVLDGKSALDVQVGGAHYKDMKIQPVEFIHANGIGYFEGNVIKYVSRWRNKNGRKDLEKARHYIDLLIELETPKHPAQNAAPEHDYSRGGTLASQAGFANGVLGAWGR